MAPPRRGLATLRGVAPFVSLLALAGAGYFALWAIDFGTLADNPLNLWTSPDVVGVLSNFAEVTIAVLGVAITVVAILVELASTRYTARVAELFVHDRVSRLVMGYFVVASVLILWIELSLREGHPPRAMALAAVVLETTSLLLLLPYFVYVFDFLSPTRVIERIQEDGSAQLEGLVAGRLGLEGAREGVVRAVEQLGDIALNSIENKDKSLTLAAVGALEELVRQSVRHKPSLPAAWFDTRGLSQSDQDFIALHPDMVRALTDRRTWVEMKVFRQYQDVFGEAVNRMRDVNHLIAIHTRQVVRAALEAEDRATVDLAVKFFNTYLRAAINARDVRTAYNLFNEYRLVAEHAQRVGHTALVVDIANWMKFYGQLAFTSNLAFLLETVAFDLSMLIEATPVDASSHDALLAVILDVDREPEGLRGQEASLRGVRKAQIRLATWYLLSGDAARADRIAKDMAGEPKDRLRSIRGELERVTDQEYWEVSDRGVNFEWLPPDRRALLPAYFGKLGL